LNALLHDLYTQLDPLVFPNTKLLSQTAAYLTRETGGFQKTSSTAKNEIQEITDKLEEPCAG
jgi:hypothetical protein